MFAPRVHLIMIQNETQKPTEAHFTFQIKTSLISGL